MASIYGIQLKKVKKTYGIEGVGFQADLYMDGKKVGYAADYADGSMLNVHVENAVLVARVRQYYAENPKEDFLTTYSNIKCAKDYIALKNEGKLPVMDYSKLSDGEILEDFCNELYFLHMHERTFKRAIRQDWKAIIVTDYKSIKGVPTPLDQIYYTNGSASAFESVKKAAEKKCTAVELKQYRSLNDFVIPMP